MNRLTDELHATIRSLYFVERMPLHVIGERLALSAHAIRAALVVPGGGTPSRSPPPALVAHRSASPLPPSTPPARASTSLPSRRRIAARHR